MRTLALLVLLAFSGCTVVLGVGGGLAGQKLGGYEHHPVAGAVTGALVGGVIGLLLDRFLWQGAGKAGIVAQGPSPRRYATAASSKMSSPGATTVRAP